MKICGNGTIGARERKSNPYQCRTGGLRVIIDIGATKVKKSKTFHGTKSEAQQALANGIDELRNNNHIEIMNFSEYADYFMKYRKNLNQYSPNTLRDEEEVFRRLKEMFGSYQLQDLTPKLIRDKFSDIRSKTEPDKQISNTRKSKYQSVLNKMLKMALIDKYIETNPMDLVERIKKESKEKRALEKNEFDALISALSKEPLSGKVMLIYFMAYLGLRKQEATVLKGNDWDKETNTLMIQRAFKEADKSIGKTKSKSSTRILPIPNPLREVMLKGEKVFNDNKIDSEGICCQVNGKIIKGGRYYEGGKKFNKSHGLRYVTFHELRHTNFTLISRGVSTFDLKDLAGWSDLKPAQIYVHKNQKSLRDGMNKIFDN